MSYNGNGNSFWPALNGSNSLNESITLSQPTTLNSKQRPNMDHRGQRPLPMDEFVPLRRRKSKTDTSPKAPKIDEPHYEEPEPQHSTYSRPFRSKAVTLDNIFPTRRTRTTSTKSVQPQDEGIKKWVQYAQIHESETSLSLNEPQVNEKENAPFSKVNEPQNGLSSSKHAPHNGTENGLSSSKYSPQNRTKNGLSSSKHAPQNGNKYGLSPPKSQVQKQENGLSSSKHASQNGNKNGLSPPKSQVQKQESGISASQHAPQNRWTTVGDAWNVSAIDQKEEITAVKKSPYISPTGGIWASMHAPKPPLGNVKIKSSWSEYGVHEEPKSVWGQFKETTKPEKPTPAKQEETKPVNDWNQYATPETINGWDNVKEENHYQPEKPLNGWNQYATPDPINGWNTSKEDKHVQVEKPVNGWNQHATPVTTNGWNTVKEDHNHDQTATTDEAKSPWSHFKEEEPPKYPGGACDSQHAIPGYDFNDNWRKKGAAALNRFGTHPIDKKRHNYKERDNASSRWQQIAAQNESNGPPGYQHLDDRNKYGKRLLFTPFMDPVEMEKGVNEGKLYQGVLRVAKNRQDSYVISDDLDHDIYVGGMIDRNRALTGDLVVVELLDDVDKVWQLRKERQLKRQEDRKTDDGPVPIAMDDEDELDHEEEEEENAKPKYCGRVVGILSRPENTTYAGTICVDRVPSQKPKEERPKELRIAWFRPSDKRVPFIALTNNDIPKDLLTNEEYFMTHLFSVKITCWRIHELNPTGKIVAELGPIGDLSAEKTAILADNSIIDAGFSPLALQCLPETPWVIPESEYAKRRDLRSARVFSIDPITAKDLDDALHVKELSDGLVEVGVHIADVSYFLKPNTVLDSEAKERGTSTYLVDSVIPMLPSLLCEELCSLNPGVERLAFSVIWKMDKKGNIQDTWFGRTIIKSCAKLAYEDAQNVIEGKPVRDDLQVYNDEDIFYIYSDIRRLFKLSKELRKQRYNNGCLSMNSVKLNFELDENGLPTSVSTFEAKEANRLIEEFMLCANISVAQKICQAFPNESLLRRHQEPLERRLEQFLKVTDVLGLNFNGNSAGELQESFNNLKNETVKDIMLVLAIRCMQKAKYFCSGALDISKFKHYALSEDIYTHFTSPIRRYPDVIVHRLLEAALDYEQNPGKTKVAPYTKKMIQKTALHCNGKKDSAKNAQDENSLLYLAKYLVQMEEQNGPVYKKATVIVVGKQMYDIHLAEYGLEKRIHLDGLPVEKFNFDKHTLALDIYWKRGVPVTMHNEEKIYAQQREREDDYSDEDDNDDEDKEVEDSLAALTLQEPKEYNKKVDEDSLIPPVMLDESTCKQTIKMFSVIDVRVQVNMERSPPIINLYPVNPFSGEQE